MGRWKQFAKVLGAAMDNGGIRIKIIVGAPSTLTGTCYKAMLFHLPMV
jgi:hypothetical protein